MKIYYQNIDYYLCLSNQEAPELALEAAASGSLLILTKVGKICLRLVRKDNSFYINQNIVSIVNLITKYSK